jgi:TM2 domain-containing membrane protein YozV
MARYFIFVLLSFSIVKAQTEIIDYHSPQNTKKFADHLYCRGDYLRAAEEYESLPLLMKNDTISFKVMLCYSKLDLYNLSNEKLHTIPDNSGYRYSSEHLFLVNTLKENPKGLSLEFEEPALSDFSLRRQKLINMSYFYDDKINLDKNFILSPFTNEEEIKTVSMLYDLKINPPYKSPAIAGIFSAIIPGSGKMYVGEWGDGITALLATGLLAFLAYDNFKADHHTRAWIFTGLGLLFYAGNIYGSIAAAQIFNARVNFEFREGLNFFLEENNYFMPDYDFCN